MKTFQISEQTLNAAIQYLANCPFAQVEPIIQAIRNDIALSNAAEQAKADAEKAKELELAKAKK